MPRICVKSQKHSFAGIDRPDGIGLGAKHRALEIQGREQKLLPVANKTRVRT